MSERAERLLREAVRELAGTPHQPPDFAAAAIARGRRMRRRRQAITVAAAAVAIGAIAAPYVWLQPDPQPPAESIGGPSPASTPARSPSLRPEPADDWRNGPLELPGGALLLSAGSTRQAGPTWAYDSARRRYVTVPESYTSVRVSPHRPLAAVGRPDRPTEVALYDLATGKLQWFRTNRTVVGVEWSPDGQRLLATLKERATGIYSIGLLTPDDGAFRYQPVKTRPVACLGSCQFTWAPGGREVALSQAKPVVGSPKMSPPTGPGLQLFAADDGMPTRFLPVQGRVSSSAAWSPDGSLVVVSAAPAVARKEGPEPVVEGEPTAQLVSTQTGKVVRQLPSTDVTWLAPDRLLYLDPARPGGPTVVLADPTGAEHERVDLPLELAGSDDIRFGVA